MDRYFGFWAERLKLQEEFLNELFSTKKKYDSTSSTLKVELGQTWFKEEKERLTLSNGNELPSGMLHGLV